MSVSNVSVSNFFPRMLSFVFPVANAPQALIPQVPAGHLAPLQNVQELARIDAQYPQPIRDLFSQCGLQISLLPELDLQGRVGATEYIDFLLPADLSHPVMRFTDRLGRPGIAMKITQRDGESAVLSIFQRYPEDPDNWEYESRQGTEAIRQIRSGWERQIQNNQACLERIREVLSGANSQAYVFNTPSRCLRNSILAIVIGVLFAATIALLIAVFRGTVIPKQLEESAFDCVGFASKFRSSLAPCHSAMVACSKLKF